MIKTFNKLSVIFGVILCIIGLSGIIVSRFFSSQSSPANIILPSPTLFPSPSVFNEQTARFAIFTNGVRRLFFATMYHNKSKLAYIEASDPSRVHIRQKGITWNDFFQTLPMKLTQDCLTTGTKETFCTNANESLKFYLNGTRDDTALEKEINHGDTLLISFGSETESQIQNQLKEFPALK